MSFEGAVTETVDRVANEISEETDKTNRPKVLEWGSPEMLNTWQRLKFSRLGGSVNQLTIELHAVPEPIEL